MIKNNEQSKENAEDQQKIPIVILRDNKQNSKKIKHFLNKFINKINTFEKK